MSELTQAGLDGDTSSTLQWQPATTEEREHAQAVWEKKAAEVRNIDPPLAAVRKFLRNFWSK